MTTTSELHNSPAIARYLAELRAGLGALPAAEQDAVVADISDHIAAEVDALPAGADIHTVEVILDRLGNPTVLAADAAGGVRAPVGSPAAEVVKPPSGFTRFRNSPGYAAMTVLILGFGGVLVPVLGWVTGVVFLWISSVWQVRHKVIGTLVLPGGFGIVFLLSILPLPVTSTLCSSSDNGPETCVTDGPPLWVGPTILAVVILAQIASMIYLYFAFKRQLARR